VSKGTGFFFVAGWVSKLAISSTTRLSWLFFKHFFFGRLDEQVGDIFRRAFASRIYSPAVVRQMGVCLKGGVG
jgi:hypothetical protein